MATTITLSSSNAGVATVPATVTIAAGTTSGAFSITGLSQGTSTITATPPAGLGASVTCTATVAAPATTISLACPAAFLQGSPGTATVTISAAQSVATTITLSSSNPGVATVPASVTISAGTTSATFNISGVSQGTSLITATLPAGLGGATRTCTATVTALAPVITSFTATPPAITAGGSATLSWSTTNATTVNINNNVGTQLVSGFASVTPTVTTTYTLTASGPGGTQTAQTTVTVNAALPEILNFSANPASIEKGQPTTLFWSTANTSIVTISGVPGTLPPSGSIAVSPESTQTYVLTASGPGGFVTRSTEVAVSNRQPRVEFTASPATIRSGQSSTLFFSTQNATSVTLDGVAVSGTSGAVTVTPTQTTTYTLVATSADGSRTTAQVTVTVIASPAVIVTAFPAGLLASPGVAGSIDRVSFTNAGGAAAIITLTQTGSFFSIAPTSLSIAPGATETVTITATTQLAGSYEGIITATGSGIQGSLSIPVRLLVSAPPQGPVVPSPQSNRVDVTQLAGSLPIMNSGSATLQGILVSDVPWLIPQAGVITILPGQTVTVAFSIDPTKRPDGLSPIGAVTGNITLVYLEQPASGATAGMIQALANTPVTGNKGFQVIHLATPVSSMSAIPPLAAGEIAFFLPGLAKKAKLRSDLTVVNAAPSSLSNLRLFFASSGTLTTTVPRALIDTLAPSGKAHFSDLVEGVFKRPAGQVGGVQVRGAAADRINLAAAVTNPIHPAGIFTGSIASQRSDRGVGANGKTVLTGVRKDSGAYTDLYVQEVAGQPGSVRIDFLGEDGTVRKTRTDTIGPFAILELANEAPSGSVSANVTNLGAGSRIIAQALVFDESTGDPTNLVDWNQRNGTAASEAQIIPLAASGVANGKKTRTDVWITNSGTTTATGTLAFSGGSSRNRPVRRSSTSGSAGAVRIEQMATPRTITVEAGKTRVLRDVVATEFSSITASGYLLYTPMSGLVAITSGTFKDAIGAQPGASGSSGTSVPVIAASTGLRKGQTRQFSNLQDSEAEKVRTAESSTFRTGFGLIESSGKSVVVAVTLRYFPPFVTGSLAAPVPFSVTKTYVLPPRGSIFAEQMGTAIFGQGPGSLHDLVLEIGVSGGEGRVIPFTLATENGSGDTILRIE